MSRRKPERPKLSPRYCARILLALLVLPAVLAQALPEDRDQPIHITADKALRDEKQGVTTYSGSVRMRQGSMELEADTLTIYHNDEDTDNVIAEGSPARMRQQPEPDKGIVHAEAGVIRYFRKEERVHLQHDARIEQEGDLVTGDSIDYFIAKQLVKAESDQTVEGPQVVVVIQPTLQQDDEGAGPGENAATDEEDPADKGAAPPGAEDSGEPVTGDEVEDTGAGGQDPSSTTQQATPAEGPTAEEENISGPTEGE